VNTTVAMFCRVKLSHVSDGLLDDKILRKTTRIAGLAKP